MKSINWGANFNTANARYFSKFSVEGEEYTTTLNNFKYSNIINPNNDISLGNTCASSVTFSIFKPTISLENKEITIFEGTKVGNEIKYLQLGIFIVDKQESDGEYTKYTAYDRMYKADMPYFSELTFPNTDKAILQEICSQMGMSLATSISTIHSISEKPNGYTRREMIGYMAMLQGCNAIMNSDGNLELKWFKEVNYPIDGHLYYQQGVTFTTSKNFVVEKLTCNNTASGATEQSEITSGSGATGLTLSNPFMTQANLDEIYNKIGKFTFRPLSVKFVGDFRLDVGDIVTVKDKEGNNYKVPIMQITHECDGGLISTATSIGQSESSNSTASSGPITKAMQRYYAELVTINQALINKLDVETAKITYATITNLDATNANIEKLNTDKLSASYADIINGNVENLKSANAEIANLKATALTSDIADIKYAQIDFANVKGQVVDSSLIKDGAVTNEKVQSLSANKLTAGIIDASKITVTNLNADNITVGTINGQRIGNKSIDLNKLSEEVPTKEYLDKVQEELQGQIDGNIETFTKTEIPTLNNSPASDWTDNATKKKHIGDICYVVNPQSSADGYCYRFANLGTDEAPDYSWVLIKDNDVTKALQDIININGEISGIKEFDTQISSWKTSTDSELSSLKTRTTTLETDMGNKVDTKTFSEIKQTVDENSSTITKMSETLSKKADSSTVTALSNTVNSIKQTTDSNTSSISSMQTTIKNKADSSTVTALSNTVNSIKQTTDSNTSSISSMQTTIKNKADSSTVTALSNTVNSIKQTTDSNTSSISSMQTTIKNKADSSTVTALSNEASELKQSLNGFKATVSDTYATKTDLSTVDEKFANYSTTAQMNSAITQSANKITSSVSATYTTKTELNNLQIGGVNRFIKSTATTNKYITAAGTITDGGNYWDLTDYINVSKWTHYIASGWTNLGNAPATCFFDSNKKFISGVADKSTGVRGSLPVPSNAVYMRFSFAHVDANKLKIEKGTKATDYSPAPEDIDVKFNNYATTASLDLYIKKDPNSGELKSAIEAIAEDITLKAAGSINISGSKSVDISGNLLTVAADNLTITSDGKITCKDANLQGTFKNVSTSGNYTLTTTIQGGEYRIANSDGSYMLIQGHLIELSKEGGTEKAIQIGRSGILDNGFLSVNGQTLLKGSTFMNGHVSLNEETFLNGETYVNDTAKLKLYHPSIKRYMQPAYSTANPVSFEWTGSALNILVDNVIVATWNWGTGTWSG